LKLWALGDLHLANRVNRQALTEMPSYPEDWLILAGDMGETEAHLRFALDVLRSRFRQLIWVPGNHDLWTLSSDVSGLRGVAKYQRLVEVCRSYGVRTPEDPFIRFPRPGEDGRHYLLAPLFLLYDYSFRPAHELEEEALTWAAESGIMCSDEILLHAEPHSSRAAWCDARLKVSEDRLVRAAATGDRLVLINHWPLRQDLLFLRRIPRFSLWCGTTRTEDWHTRFNAAAVVYGHLHMKGTHFRDGVRFEEVSLGYPRDWDQARGPGAYLRQILPEPDTWLGSS